MLEASLMGLKALVTGCGKEMIAAGLINEEFIKLCGKGWEPPPFL